MAKINIMLANAANTEKVISTKIVSSVVVLEFEFNFSSYLNTWGHCKSTIEKRFSQPFSVQANHQDRLTEIHPKIQFHRKVTKKKNQIRMIHRVQSDWIRIFGQNEFVVLPEKSNYINHF